ncbi:MAG: hypothetical protein GEV08_21760 [Acidimicrobiia bacterium]|nr:hypothetical protein [Acidimicrobiia bacterium]
MMQLVPQGASSPPGRRAAVHLVREDRAAPVHPSDPAAQPDPGDRSRAGAGAQLEPQQGGFVLVWTVLVMVVLLGAVGLAVDVANWTTQGNRLQTVADGAAMAGAVFLPDRPEEARLAAQDVINATGRTDIEAVIEQGTSANQLRVAVRRTVDNAFATLFGFDRTAINRDATAEFSAPVEMGSPEFIMGNDPEREGAQPDYFLGLAGPDANKQMGDRYASRFCQGAVECEGGVNDTYDPEGYTYVARVGPSTPAGPLRIQLFDPAFVEGGTVCQQTAVFPSAERLEELKSRSGTVPGLPAGWYEDAPTRYAGGKSPFCTGDNDVNGASVETSVIVRAPDDTPWDDTDNPILSQPACEATTFPAWSPAKMGATLDQLLDPASGHPDQEWVVDPSDGRWTLAEVWRRWVSVCEIPASQVTQGDYVVQVRSSARASDPTMVDTTVATAGQNFFSLRAGAATETGVDGTGMATFGRGRLPIYANKDGAETTIYAVKLQPGGTGRVLTIGFYDAGDASQPGSLQVLPPEDSNVGGVFRGCAFRRADGVEMTASGDDSCTVVDVSRATGFNGQLMYADVPISDDYTCDRDSATGCWVKVRLAFPGGVEDFTTWSAGVTGAPVRLVE